VTPAGTPAAAAAAAALLTLRNFCFWLAGDAILNVRKAKLIPSYELCIKVKWQGTTADGQAGSGLIELPYVADENHDEDPEIR
jgi:activator of HSP90 ATPase